jgi:siroheme synthase
LAGSGATLVIYMPGQNYNKVASKLKAAGLAAEAPCAVISRGTTPHQRTHISTLAELHRSPKLAAPTLLVVGEVVRFADPASLADQFGAEAIRTDDNRALPVAIVSGPHPSEFTTTEEPLS